MNMVLFFAQVAALSVIWYRGLVVVVPWFLFSIALALPMLWGYDPTSPGWIEDIYMRVEPLVFFLRMAAAAEALWLVLPERTRFRVVATSGQIALSCMMITWLASGSPQLGFVEFRRYGQIFNALAMSVGVLFLWRTSGLIGWRWGTLQRHVVLVLLVMWNHALVGIYRLHLPGWTYLGWYAVQPITFGVAAALYTAWAILILWSPAGRISQTGEEPYTLL